VHKRVAAERAGRSGDRTPSYKLSSTSLHASGDYLARTKGGDLHRQVPATGLLGGRPIKIADGTTVSMPDTEANQRAYPQEPGQKKGLGFPIMRLVGLISLSCGAVLGVAMVRKEIWMHLLAYNLIRTLMAQAALEAGVCPRDISFKGTLQTMLAFAAAGWSCSDRRNELYASVLSDVATHRVNDRPDRIEPRAVKRRPKKTRLLNEPRTVAKAHLLYGT